MSTEFRQQKEVDFSNPDHIFFSLIYSRNEISKIIKEVAEDYNLMLTNDDLTMLSNALLKKADMAYIKERVEDILSDEAEELLQEMRFDFSQREADFEEHVSNQSDVGMIGSSF